jgi:hypothetical protein
MEFSREYGIGLPPTFGGLTTLLSDVLKDNTDKVVFCLSGK